jgi:phosphotriesterase-related protein
VRTCKPATITTHAEMYPGLGITQLDVLAEEGVDPSNVVIGHASTIIDGTYHRDVLRRGAYLQFDTVGRNDLVPDAFVAERIRELVDDGFAEQLLVSMDICRRSHLAFFGGHGFGFLLDDFVPRLLEAGLTQTTVDTITRENPARAICY